MQRLIQVFHYFNMLTENIFILLSILSSSGSKDLRPLSKKFIKYINNGMHSWTAGKNFPEDANILTIKQLMGGNFDDPYYTILANSSNELEPGEELPVFFDSRQKWRECPSLNETREQGACASCWAVAAAATMTDRYCIYSNQTQNYHFSTGDLHSCCIHYGCKRGGHISVAWQYWNLFGIVSGGEYNSSEGCKPFQLPPCDFYKGCNTTVLLPMCFHKCTKDYYRSYKKDKKFAKHVYSVKGGEEEMMLEIFKNGPVEAVMAVYADFLCYKTGVYRHVTGDYFGGHAVKLLGWGIKNGHKYWLAANSWGDRWGDSGFFKIVRGENHCRVESIVMAGEPSLDRNNSANINLNFDNKLSVHLDWNV